MKTFISLYIVTVFMFLKFSVAKIEYSRRITTSTTSHKPRVLAKTCLLKPDKGPCRGDIDMYYFSPSKKDCSVFLWGGCQGNGNRFDTREECLSFCLSTPDTPRNRPNWCSLAFDYGFCFGEIERYYFDPLWKVCKKTIYSGCGGNKNNFYNEEQCDSICRFGKGPLSKTSKPRTQTKPETRKVPIINPWKPKRKSSRATKS